MVPEKTEISRWTDQVVCTGASRFDLELLVSLVVRKITRGPLPGAEAYCVVRKMCVFLTFPKSRRKSNCGNETHI
jgi:hypothetical protein